VRLTSRRLDLALPVAAVVLGLVAGALVMWSVGNDPVVAYLAMAEGSFGGLVALGRTLEKATPLILTGLAVAFAFKAGLFNIGGQGQLLLGASFAAYVGFRFGLPAPAHIPLGLIVGALAGSVLGAVVGILKAYRGAHEVITTIMFNFVAANLTEWLVSRRGPWHDPPETNPSRLARTPLVEETARIPRVEGLPLGFLVAVAAAVAVWYLLSRTTFGFQVQTVGANRFAAAYAGISVTRTTVYTMAISASLAGLGGAIQTQGVTNRFEPGLQAGLGFAGITIALLARTHPLAVIPAALLIGAMSAGAPLMQSRARVDPTIIDIIQALILFFVAAPMVVRWILRLRADEAERDKLQLSTGWGSATR
jgi:simple sugar transport system permease protein